MIILNDTYLGDEFFAGALLDDTALIRRALSALTKGKTVLTIARRLAAIRYADQILAMEDGRIVQRGTHAELMAAGMRERKVN